MTAERVADNTEWTVRRVLDWTIAYLKQHGSESPRLEAEVLLAHARGCPRIQLYTQYDEVLSDDVRGRMRALVKRRAAAEPVAYLVGHREFFSLDFEVTPDVFIPRPDTETLVLEALTLSKLLPAPQMLDLGTGSGCIAVALAVNTPAARLTAVDQSAAALVVARRNAEKHHVGDRVRFLHGDLFAPLPPESAGSFDLIVSNPPYIPAGEIAGLQDDVRQHEPRAALDGGADGLAVVRRIADEAPRFLKPGGGVLLEIGPEQAAEVVSLFGTAAWVDSVQAVNDLTGRPRVVRVRSRK